MELPKQYARLNFFHTSDEDCAKKFDVKMGSIVYLRSNLGYPYEGDMSLNYMKLNLELADWLKVINKKIA